MAKRKWGKADWSLLKASFIRKWGSYICEADVDEAVARIFADAAIKTGVSVKVLARKNRKFFDKKAEVFEYTTFYTQTHPQLVMVKELLIVPIA